MRTSIATFCAAVCAANSVRGELRAPAPTNAPIVVTATAISKYRVDAPASAMLPFASEQIPQVVDVLTEDFIRDRNPTDLDNLLSFQPGVFTGGKTLLSRTAGQYTMRGLSGNQVLLNGVVPMSAGMGTFMDPALLERVELPKGPVGAVYGGQGSALGPYGAGGAIIVWQKRAATFAEFANAELRSSFVADGGQRHRLTGDANQTLAAEDSGVSGLWLRTPLGIDFNKPFWINDGQDWAQAYTLAPSVLFESDDIRAGLDASIAYSDRPGYQGISIFKGKPREGYDWDTNLSLDDMRAEYLGVTFLPWLELNLSDALALRAGAGFAWNSMDYDQVGPASGIPTAAAPYEANTGDTTARNYNAFLHAVYKTETARGAVNTLTSGADWTLQERSGVSAWQNVATPRFLDRSLFESTKTEVEKYGVFVNDGVEFGDLRAVLGLRYDHYRNGEDNSADTWSPRAGVSYSVTPRVIPFANVMRVSAPNFGNLGEDGRELTESWVATQYEGGVRVSPVGDLWLAASAFHIKQRNTPLSITGSPNGPFVSDGATSSRGVELSASGNITRNWSLYAAYTFIDFDDENAASDYDRFPPHSASIYTTYKFERGVMNGAVFGFGWRYRDGFDLTTRGMWQGEDYATEAWHVFDASVEIPVRNNASLSFAVKNIFDERFVESARNMQCFPGEPRTFEVALRMKF